jgi:hypothetical protein
VRVTASAYSTEFLYCSLTAVSLLGAVSVTVGTCGSASISELKSELKQDLYWIRRETDTEIKSLRSEFSTMLVQVYKLFLSYRFSFKISA